MAGTASYGAPSYGDAHKAVPIIINQDVKLLGVELRLRNPSASVTSNEYKTSGFYMYVNNRRPNNPILYNPMRGTFIGFNGFNWTISNSNLMQSIFFNASPSAPPTGIFTNINPNNINGVNPLLGTSWSYHYLIPLYLPIAIES